MKIQHKLTIMTWGQLFLALACAWIHEWTGALGFVASFIGWGLYTKERGMSYGS